MENNVSDIDFLDFPEFNVCLKSNGIVYVYFKQGTEIDVEFQEKLLSAYNTITKGKLHPFIFHAEEEISVTKEARDNAIIIEERSPVAKSAVIVKNIAHKLIANFYIKFNKPKRPYKVFKDVQEAEQWLLED